MDNFDKIFGKLNLTDKQKRHIIKIHDDNVEQASIKLTELAYKLHCENELKELRFKKN